MNELAPLSSRLAAILERAHNHPPLRVPLMLTSRSDPPAARLISAAIAVLLQQHWDSGGVSAIATFTTGEKS
jgi:hypothetical protein